MERYTENNRFFPYITFDQYKVDKHPVIFSIAFLFKEYVTQCKVIVSAPNYCNFNIILMNYEQNFHHRA